MTDHTDLIARLKALYPSETHAPTVHEAIAALAASRPEPPAAPDVGAEGDRIKTLAAWLRVGTWLHQMNATNNRQNDPAIEEAAAALLAQQRTIAELRRETVSKAIEITELTDRAESAEAALAAARRVAAEQAEDAGLWFVAIYASEAHLQAALRQLHAAVEGDAAAGAEDAK